MFRTDDQIAARESIALDVKKALDRAGVGTRYQRMPGVHHCEVAAWLNYGNRVQRRLSVLVYDNFECNGFLSRPYTIPTDKTADDMLMNESIPRLFSVVANTPNPGDEIVAGVAKELEEELERLAGVLLGPADLKDAVLNGRQGSPLYYPTALHFRNAATILRRTSSVLSLQTFVVPGARAEEGIVIEATSIPWRRIVDEFRNDPDWLLRLDPRKFEELIAASYKQAGFDDVFLTPRSADGGKDVIAVKRGFVTVRVLDQVKKYKPGHLVDADEVRALIGVLHSDRSATNGVVTTTSDFAPRIRDDSTITPFLPARLQLINGAELVKRLSELK